MSEKSVCSTYYTLGALGYILSTFAWLIEIPLPLILEIVFHYSFWQRLHEDFLVISFPILFISLLLVGVSCIGINKVYRTYWAISCAIFYFLAAGLTCYSFYGVISGVYDLNMLGASILAFLFFNVGQLLWAVTLLKSFLRETHNNLTWGTIISCFLSGIFGVHIIPVSIRFGTVFLFLSMTIYVISAAMNSKLLLRENSKRTMITQS